MKRPFCKAPSPSPAAPWPRRAPFPRWKGCCSTRTAGLTISGYNLQTGIRTKVSADVTEPGEIVLNARLFGDIIRRMPDDVVVFTADDKQLVHLSCGDADFDILGLSAADYPELPMVEDDFSVSIQQKLLRAMIEETAFAVSTNESRPIHTGALFEITDQGLTMVAVDGFRLAIRRGAAGKDRRWRLFLCGAGQRPGRGEKYLFRRGGSGCRDPGQKSYSI